MKMLSDNLYWIIPSVLVILVLVVCSVYIRNVEQMKNPSARHWSSIPGFCMGVGIAATFISLFITFQGYKESTNLSILIKEVSGAFLGSLAGLAISLYMTYKIKTKITEIEEKEQNKAGENANPYILLQQIVENTSSNKSELEKLNKAFDTFNSKTERLNSDMNQDFTNNLKALMASVKTDAIDQSLKSISDIHQKLSEKLEGVFGVTNGTISSGQEAIKDEINKMNNEVSQKIDDFIASRIESLERTFKRIEEYQTRSQTILETTTNSFKETVEKYAEVNDDKTEIIENTRKQLYELEEVRKNGSTLIQNWDNIAKSMEGMQDRINQINSVITQLDGIKTVLVNQQKTNDVQ
jgi:chromosome segregation ATPase